MFPNSSRKKKNLMLSAPFSKEIHFQRKKSTTQQKSKYSYTNQPRLRLIGGDALCLDRLKSNRWKLFKMDP